MLACYVVLEAIAGARRSPLVPVLPRGGAAPAWASSLAAWLSIRDATATTLAVLALAVVAASCVLLGVLAVEAWRGRVAVRTVLMAAVAAAALVAAGPVLLSRDVTSYAAYGRMLAFHQANPYVHAPSAFPYDPYTTAVSREWLRARSVYGPVFTLISVALVRLGGADVARTLLLFRSLAAVSAIGALLLAVDAARRLRPGREALAAALIGLNPVVVVHTIGGGHNDALMALFLAAAAWTAVATKSARRSGGARPAGALAVTVLLTLAALVKAVAGVLLLQWLLTSVASSRASRARALATHVAAIVTTSVALFAPLFAGAATLRSILGAASRQGWASPAAMVARLLSSPITPARAGPALATAVEAVFLAGFLVLVATVLRRGLRPTRSLVAPDAVSPAAWATTMLLLALTVPYLLPWYAMWFLPLLPLADDPRELAAGAALTGLLALTGIPTEPGVAPTAWRAMVSAVHYGAASIALGLLLFLGVSIVRQRAGAITTSRSPNARA